MRPFGNLSPDEANNTMVWANWAMVWITMAATVVGALSLFLLRQTWREADRTARAAEAQLDISRRAAAKTEEIGRKQVRAYLGVRVAKVLISENDATIDVAMGVSLANTGQSPAGAVTVDYALTYGPLTIRKGLVTVEKRRIWPSIAAGEEIYRSTVAFSVEDAESFSNELGFMWELRLTIHWIDVFEDTQTHQARFTRAFVSGWTPEAEIELRAQATS